MSMTDSKPVHEPGPWGMYQQEPRELRLKRPFWIVGREDGDRRGVAFVFGADEANARLVSAAPDLAEALEELRVIAAHDTGCFTDEWEAADAKAVAALKRAGRIS